MREREREKEAEGKPSAATLTLSVGQAVPWPPAPLGIAQVADLRRSRVRLCYPSKNGRMRYPVVRVADLAKHGALLFDLSNPFNRGVLPRSRTFPIG